MAIKGSGKVTITLDRKTVAMLRAKKKGLETWDELMQRLGRKRKWGIECIICGATIEMTEANISPAILAKANGWREVYSGRVRLEDTGIKTDVELGYMCKHCGEENRQRDEH
jgi:DNA-directed RNA polymerase subunit RPC12/RpoP